MKEFNSGYNSLKELYETHLYKINEVNFTFREIDVIACILHNRSDKKIASILLVSPRTVNSHVYNIMGKLCCNSKDQIIDFIEKSEAYLWMKTYYMHLLVRNIFKKQLIQIAKTINLKTVYVKYDKKQKIELDEKFYQSIEQHLNLANIKLIEDDDLDNSKIDISSVSDENQSDLMIDFTNISQEGYYHDIFTVLQKLLPLSQSSAVIKEFDDQYQIIKNNNDGIKNNIKNNSLYFIKKLFHQKYSVVLGIVFVLFSLAVIFFVQLILDHFSLIHKDIQAFGELKLGAEPSSKNKTSLSLVDNDNIDADIANMINFEIKQKRDSNYIERKLESGKNIFEEFDYILEHYDNVLVTAPGGSGKSSCVLEYAYRMQEKNKKVIFFDSDSIDKINQRYKELAVDLGINISALDQAMIIRQVNGKLRVCQDLIFIFDNSRDYADVEKYISQLPKGIKYIITSRNSNLVNNISKGQHIELRPHFTDEAARKYVIQSLPDRFGNSDEFTSSKLEQLLLVVSKSPIRLAFTVSYLHKNKIVTIDEYIELYKAGEADIPEFTLLYGDINSNKHEKELSMILQYAAYLDPDFISIKILKSVLRADNEKLGTSDNKANKHNQKLQSYIEDLESMSLVKLVRKDNDEVGVKIHRLIQKDIATFIDRHTQLVNSGVLMDKATIYKRLFSSINKLMPKVAYFSGDDWTIASLLYPSAIKLVEHFHADNININTKINIKKPHNKIFKDYVSLMNKLGLYQEYIAEKYHTALEYYEYAEQYAAQYADSEDVLAEISLNKGWCYFKQRKLQKAIDSFERAMQLATNKESELYADALSGMGCVYDQQRNSNEGLKYHETAYKIYKKLYGDKDHFVVARSLHNLAWSYKNLDRDLNKGKDLSKEQNKNLVIALDKLMESYEMRKRLYPNGVHLDIAASLNSIGDTYRKQGGVDNLRKALQYQQEALAMRNYIHNNHITLYTISSYSRLGETYRDLGDYGHSLEYFEKLLSATYEMHGTYNHSHILGSLQRIAEIYQYMGNDIEAIEYYKKAYTLIYRNDYDINYPGNTLIEDALKTHASEFVQNPELRIFITKRGHFDQEIYKIKSKLQTTKSTILNKLYDCGRLGLWNNSWFNNNDIFTYGAAYYLTDKHLKEILGENITEKELVIAKTLCFEAINLGVMSASKEERKYDCLFEFIKTYPKLIEQIIKKHPEYFIDGSLLIECNKREIITTKQLETLINKEELDYYRTRQESLKQESHSTKQINLNQQKTLTKLDTSKDMGSKVYGVCEVY